MNQASKNADLNADQPIDSVTQSFQLRMGAMLRDWEQALLGKMRSV